MLLAGQSPLGEVLATPSATELDGIAICLVDVTDEIRVERLRKRDGARSTPETERDYLRWAAWHRHHAQDPQFEPSVIRGTCADAVWNRWTGWSKGDPRWDLAVIDTSGVSVADAAPCLMAWVDQQLGLWRDSALSLGQGWLAGPREAAT